MASPKRLLLASALLTGAALAADGIVPGKLLLDPTFQCIGVEVTYTGDVRPNARGTVQYRASGESAWRTGHPLVRVSDKPTDAKGGGAKNPRFFSSIFCLKEDTEYEVEVKFEDPDGVSAQLPAQKVRTRNSAVKTGSGRHYYANPAAAAEGDGSQAQPYKSLEKALAAGGPGDTIHLAAGVYPVLAPLACDLSGEENAWLHIKAEPGAIVTDADPALSGAGKLAWEKFKQDEDGRWIYKLPVKDAHRVMVRKKPGDVTTGYFLWRAMQNDTTKYNGPHRGQTVAHLIENYTGLNKCGIFLQEPDALYAILPEGMDDPARVDVQISRGNVAQRQSAHVLSFKGHHVLVEGLTFDLTVSLQVAGHHIHFKRIAVYGNNGRNNISTGTYGLIEDSTFVFNTNYDWHHAPPAKISKGNRWDPWGRVKNGANDTHLVSPAQGTVFRYNYISGFNNVVGPPAPALSKNIEIHHNRFDHVYDDCIEPDGPGVNWRVYENQFSRFINGISDAPVDIGPFFVVRNSFDKYVQGAFKVRNGAAGKTLYYHNVCYPQKNLQIYSHGPRPEAWPIPNPGFDGLAFCPDQDGERWMRTRNNILIGGRAAYSVRGDKCVLMDTLDFDYNLLASVNGGNTRRVGEKHSLSGMPVFKDLEKGDLRLMDESQPGVDSGEIVKGINDEVPAPWQFTGKAPDMGLYEYGAELPQVGPRKGR
ncbi:MAG: hypothetical protein AMXMBFR7_18350 [Planctomycetota bacterium]